MYRPSVIACCLNLLVIGSFPAFASDEPLCLYVSSYHKGYAWSDGVENGLRQTIDGHCELVQFDMDTKRNKTAEHKKQAGEDAYELIKKLEPDVVITSDDNAAKFLIVPFLRDTHIPVVFSGINWTVEEYDFPASNVTGIVEIAPIKPMLSQALKVSNNQTRAAYLGAFTLSEIKNFNRINKVAEQMGINMDSILAEDLATWKTGLTLAQDYDFLIMGSHSGINNWDDLKAQNYASQESKIISLTNHDWMMPYSMIGYTKIPEEHGQWAASSAVAILSGTRTSDIPLVTNRKFDTWVNNNLLDGANIQLSDQLLRKAKKVQ